MNTRSRIYRKTNGHCAYCGIELDQFEPWQIEHAIPASRGGSSSDDNLVPACKFCNSSKRSRTPDEYREYIVNRAIEQADTLGVHLGEHFRRWVGDEKAWETALSDLWATIAHLQELVRNHEITFYLEQQRRGE